ncbi:transporter substrate-binding domain-containing protein [Treponema endosymbiont of Eucomonympha sp.]|uniref:transporter substrate-binding domain-containing protein n=2 Tax=Treponema endosymbiont of Eucomonympha sp. TaxID=1580831 RepID=UPI000750FBA4|nr:transporter substrate-binding domain-containing protein [Treponema endosymbiont of Eucomonympha sp.]
MNVKTMKTVFSMAAAALLIAGVSGCKKKAAAQNADGTPVRTVNVVTVTTNVPFAYLNDKDQYDGYEIAALREIDKRLPQYEFKISGMDFAAMPVALEAGSASIAVCMLVRSEARQAKFIFPKQYSTLSPINLVVRANRPNVNTLEDLAGMTVASTASSYEHSMLVAWNKAHPGKELILRDYSDATRADLFNAISRGEVDSTLAYPQGFDIVTKELGITNLRITPPALIEDTYYMLAKGETALRDDLDGAIKALREDGTLGRLSKQYLGEDVFAQYTAQFEEQGNVQ